MMERIVFAFFRRFCQSTSVAISPTKKTAANAKAHKLSFEEWQVLHPGGTFQEYTAKLPFDEWQALNPSGTFKEYYVGGVLDALAGKKTHATLGPLTREGSVERAECAARTLIGLGIQKSNIVVDYGCGTLRVGRPLIEYLEPSRYVGLDIDRRILDTGLSMLPPGLAEQKAPILDLINDEVLDRVASMRANWIFSKGVLHHVPPSDVGEFFANIVRFAHPETKIVLWARLSESATHQNSERTWHHGIEGIISTARNFGLDVKISQDAESRRMLRLQRSTHVTRVQGRKTHAD